MLNSSEGVSACERAEGIRAPGGWETSACERVEGRPDVVVAHLTPAKGR
jgi:hypothetical protein